MLGADLECLPSCSRLERSESKVSVAAGIGLESRVAGLPDIFWPDFLENIPRHQQNNGRQRMSVLTVADASHLLNGSRAGAILIPNHVEAIVERAFLLSSKLTSISIAPSAGAAGESEETPAEALTHIGERAFYSCKQLTRAKLPDSVVEIGERAFFLCEQLTSIQIPIGVTEISDYVFYGCARLTSVRMHIPEERPVLVKTITDPELQFLVGQKAVKINEKVVTKWSDNTFQLLQKSQTSLAIEFASSAGASNFHTFEKNQCPTAAASRAIEWTGLCLEQSPPNSVTKIGEGAFFLCSGLTSIAIPSTVTEIGAYAFYNCSGLAAITIPSSVTRIGEYAFGNCARLTSVTIPNTVTEISEYAFTSCTGLKTVHVPMGVTKINEGAFLSCTGLTSIEIPASVTEIGLNAFQRDVELVHLEVDGSVHCRLVQREMCIDPQLSCDRLISSDLQLKR